MITRLFQVFGVIAACHGAASCLLEPCPAALGCCKTCEEKVLRRNACECAAKEKVAHLCPARSVCAIDFHVGAGPAHCCPTCKDTELRTDDSARCKETEVYLHECPVESGCFQSYRAQVLQTTYLPFEQVSTGVAGTLRGIWGTPALTVWVTGTQGRLLKGDKNGWQSVDSGVSEALNAVWGSSDNDVWVVGNNGLILHYDKKQWGQIPSKTEAHLFGVWGSGPNAVWAGGTQGTILKYDGTAWSSMESGSNADLSAVWGTSATDIWAVGTAGTILHYNGAKWSTLESTTHQHLFAIWGANADEFWIAGAGGTLLRREENQFKAENGPPPIGLLGLHGSGTKDVWAVGNREAIFRFTGSRWEQISYFLNGPRQALVGVFVQPALVLVAGEGGTLLQLKR